MTVTEESPELKQMARDLFFRVLMQPSILEAQKKTKRKVQSPAKKGSLSLAVIKNAVKKVKR